jgi:hypothetical protein
MQSKLTKDQLTNYLRLFKNRRDDLLHEDVSAFDHHLERFIEFCRTNPLVRQVLAPIESRVDVQLESWWTEALKRDAKLRFPNDPDDELMLRYRIIESLSDDPRRLFRFGIARGQHKSDDQVGLFRSLIVRPFADELSHRLGEAADLATPEARAVQAVPLSRIPSPKEVKIFLSHRSVDKPLVYRYYAALKAIGFDPWLDEPNMPAGSNLEREVLRGFEESCAAVFFITENFRDEKYLAAEVDYAVMQKRKKDKKFAIITLRYADAAPVPGLLTPFIYKDVENDLQGFNELIRALPIELGPIRWKAEIA